MTFCTSRRGRGPRDEVARPKPSTCAMSPLERGTVVKEASLVKREELMLGEISGLGTSEGLDGILSLFWVLGPAQRGGLGN